MRILVGALMAIVAAGCTSRLEVARAGSDEATRSGFAYPLQFTQWNVNIKRRLAGCEPEVKALIKAEIVPATVDDGDHVYVISSNSLTSSMKISDLQIAWDQGRLKSVNASAEDRTAQTALAAVQGIGKLISVAAGPTMGIVSAGGVRSQVPANGPQLVCRDETIANLALAETTEEQVEAAGSAIAVATAEATRLKEQLDQLGEDAAVSALLKTQLEKIATQKANLAVARKKLENALAFLTHEQLVSWPERSGTNWTDEKSAFFEIPAPALKKWFVTVDFLDGNPVLDGTTRRERDASLQDLREVTSAFRAFMRIERIGSYGHDPSLEVTRDTSLHDNAPREAGIRYRLPARGRLVVCQARLCTSADKDATVATAVGPVLQLGQIFYAPFSSPPFSNGTFAMAFDEYGRPVSAGIGRKTASAETIAGLARDIANEVATVAAEVHQTPLEQLQDQRAFLEETKKLADAQAALDRTKTPLEELQELSQLAQARKQYQDALAALEPAVADPNADTQALQAGFEADAALLKAKADLIAAEIALRDLERRRSEP